jgi:membrane-associated phospholipid phosphatase
LLGALEAFTRFYLLQHWPTDLVGGWIFGELLLLVILAAVWPVGRLRPALIDDDDDETGESARAPLTGH